MVSKNTSDISYLNINVCNFTFTYRQLKLQIRNMRFFTLVFILISLSLQGQVDLNMDLVSRVDAFEGANDVWGFEHSNGVEYAVLGTQGSTKIYSLANPTTPVQEAVIPGIFTAWRDMKNYNDYVYVTADNVNNGLTIIDMTDPENIDFKIWSPTLWIGNAIDSLKSCHNLFIDEDGFGYLAGCNISNKGVIIIDLATDPLNPTMVGYADQTYSHDVYVKGDRMYSSEINNGWLGIYDISDKENPVRIATQETGTNFTHNAWTSDDQNFIFTTDEKPNAYLEAYDISDLSDIQKLDAFRPPVTEGQDVYPHNTHYHDGFLITSWYTDGVVVVDAHRPENLVKVAGYDTWLGAHGDTNGCWGAYPFLPSGLILASDRMNGLHVLNPSYQRACYLEGRITSAGTGLPINGATISIISPNQLAKTNSDAAGEYKTGVANSGIYDVVVTHPLYDELTTIAEMINGEITILDLQLIKPGATVYNGTVVKDIDGELVPNAMIKLIYPDSTIEERVTDDSGSVLLELQEGVYDIYATTWGYNIGHYQFDTSTDPIIEVRLEEGYRDEFFFDHPWLFFGGVDEGFFSVGEPQELILNNHIINIGQDNQEDIGTRALLTGDGTNHPLHLDYVKEGSTIAVSPSMNLNSYEYPVLKFDLFYRHDGYTIPGSYTFDVEIRRGSDHRMLRRFEMSDTTWTSIELHPKQVFWDLEDIKISFRMFNDIDGIFTEVAIDVFEVVEGSPSSIQEFAETELLIYPNPSQDEFNISLESLDFDNYLLTNITGQLIKSEKINDLNFTIDGSHLNPGIYFLQLKSDQALSRAYRIIKQ